MFLNKTVTQSSLLNYICIFLNKTVNKSSLLNLVCNFLNKTVNQSSLLNQICIFLNKTVNKSSLFNLVCIFLNKTVNYRFTVNYKVPCLIWFVFVKQEFLVKNPISLNFRTIIPNRLMQIFVFAIIFILLLCLIDFE